MTDQSGPVQADLPPAIGRYQILARLASDWVDDVYRGYDPMIQRPVAVKVFRLKPAEPGAAAIKQGFFREMQRVGALTHHGIAALFDAGELPGGLFMATEFVEGVSLRELLDKGAPADVTLRASLVSQAADALEFARQLGVAHLNLKPSTVLIGADYTVKVAGFGVSSVLDALAAASSITPPASPYMAPERERGEAGDFRSDIYSLACVAADILLGAGHTLAHRAGTIPPLPADLSERGVAVEDWNRLFARAMAADPSIRHESPAEFKMELLLAIGIGEIEAQLAWDTSRAGAGPDLDTEESQTILSPSSSYPPPPGLPRPADHADADDLQTMLTPLPEPGSHRGKPSDEGFEQSATRLVEPTETRLVDPRGVGGDPHRPKR